MSGLMTNSNGKIRELAACRASRVADASSPISWKKAGLSELPLIVYVTRNGLSEIFLVVLCIDAVSGP